MNIKICEKICFGGRTVSHKIDEVVQIETLEYFDPKVVKDYKYVGFDYPTNKKQGCLIVCLKDGAKEVYPASNWYITF